MLAAEEGRGESAGDTDFGALLALETPITLGDIVSIAACAHGRGHARVIFEHLTISNPTSSRERLSSSVTTRIRVRLLPLLHDD